MKFAFYSMCVFLGIGAVDVNALPNNPSNFLEEDSKKSVFKLPKEMHFHSQASQDEFVYTLLYSLLHKNDQGYYLEIGAGEPIHINNSYFFEKNLDWKGVSIDISNSLTNPWSLLRKNPLLIDDATRADYVSILQSFPSVIDYLSLDVDGYYDVVLQQIPFNHYIFKIITIEHDSYRYGDVFKERERKMLTSLGYHLLCADVSFLGNAFEDWWIHPSAFPPSVLSQFTSLNLHEKDNKEIIKIIKTKL